MKKIVLSLLVAFLIFLAGCGSQKDYIIDTSVTSGNVTNDTSASQNVEEDTINNIEQTKNLPSPTLAPEPEKKEAEYPVLDEAITESLTKMMYGSFGGLGNEEFATSWYKYIDYWEVYREGTTYNGILHITVRPYDWSARLLLSQYYTEEELNNLIPVLIDVGAAFGLDDIDISLVGECLYKIKTYEDSSLYYYAIASYDIPIYDFLSQGFGRSIREVKQAIENNKIPGDKAFECLIDYMEYNYKGTFNGLSMEGVKRMAMAALSGFDDVRIETMTVYDNDNKLINTYQKLN